MIEAIITCTCIYCNKEYDGDEISFTCDDCVEKSEFETGKNLLKLLYEDSESVIDGENSIGFHSENEKIIFFKGVRVGFNHAGFKIADYFGDETIDLWDNLSNQFTKLEIKANYDDVLEKKHGYGSKVEDEK